MAIKKPNIKYTPTDINGTINIKQNTQSTATSTKFSKENDEAINTIVPKIYKISSKIRYIRNKIKRMKKGYQIPFNATEMPLLDEAVHCPYCGNANADNVINEESDLLKAQAQKTINESIAEDLGAKSSTLSAEDVSAKQQQSWVKMLNDIITDLIKEIVSIVIDAINSILSLIPGVSSVLKSVSRAYRGKGLSISNVYGDLFNDGESQDLVQVEDNTEERLHYLKTKCPNHISNYNKAKQDLMELNYNEQTSACNADRVMDNVVQNYTSLMNVVDKYIPDGYELSKTTTYNKNYDDNGDSSIYTIKNWNQREALTELESDTDISLDSLPINDSINKKVDETIGANLSDIEDKVNKYLDELDSDVLDTIVDWLNDWWNNPDTICCFLQYCMDTIKANPDFFKWLKLARALLDLYFCFLDFNFNLALSSLNDIVKTILKQLTTAVLNAVSSIMGVALDIACSGLMELLGTFPEDTCVPLDKLVDKLRKTIDKLKNKYLQLIESYFNTLFDINLKLEDISETEKDKLEIKGIIKLLDIVIDYLLEIEKCENYSNYVSKYEGKWDELTSGSVSDLLNISIEDAVNAEIPKEYKSWSDFGKSILSRSEIFNRIFTQIKELSPKKDSTENTSEQAKQCACTGSIDDNTKAKLKQILKKYNNNGV